LSEPARILLVDDEVPIQRSLTPLLESRGFTVDGATTGAAALETFGRRPPDVIILDLGLPDVAGNVVCRQIRSQSDVPIIVLSARSSESEKIAALDDGADDYLTKPFSPEELLARIRVALRRVFSAKATLTGPLKFGDLTIDVDRYRVLRDITEIRLTPKEFALLVHLARHPNQVLTRHSILTAVWGPAGASHPESLWVLVSQLRKKLEPDPANPTLLVSEPWIGYRLVVEDDDGRSDIV
jgi:two-component system KDP operon response regulator KdpE